MPFPPLTPDMVAYLEEVGACKKCRKVGNHAADDCTYDMAKGLPVNGIAEVGVLPPKLPKRQRLN